MDLFGYLRILRKGWWIVLLVTLIGAAAAVGYSETATKRYASTVTFYISTPTDASGGSAFQANQYALEKVASYTKLLKSQRLAQMVVTKANLNMTSAQVASEIVASSDLNTVLLTATVVDPSAQRSLTIATALSTEFGSLVNQLDNRTTGQNNSSGSTVALNVVSAPTLNPTPVSPRTKLILTLGILGGLVLGVLLALLRGLLDNSIRTMRTLAEVSNLPPLSALYYDSAAKKNPILVGTEVSSIRAEAFRKLRTNLQFANVDHPVHVLVVTSSVPNEGKSTTAANLAIMYADTGRRVLLIEADLRKGRVADYLGLERAVGLTDVLAGTAELDDVLQSWNTDTLTVLLAGSVPPNPSELLGSHNMVTLLDRLRAMFDVIILDTPPLLPVTDAAVAATLADGVLLVVRQGKTTRTQVATSVRALQSVDARVLGAVLTMVRKRSQDTEAYSYYSAGADGTPATTVPPAPVANVPGPQVDQAPTSGSSPAGSSSDSARHLVPDSARD